MQQHNTPQAQAIAIARQDLPISVQTHDGNRTDSRVMRRAPSSDFEFAPLPRTLPAYILPQQQRDQRASKPRFVSEVLKTAAALLKKIVASLV